jgi:hypothetical protein
MVRHGVPTPRRNTTCHDSRVVSRRPRYTIEDRVGPAAPPPSIRRRWGQPDAPSSSETSGDRSRARRRSSQCEARTRVRDPERSAKASSRGAPIAPMSSTRWRGPETFDGARRRDRPHRSRRRWSDRPARRRRRGHDEKPAAGLVFEGQPTDAPVLPAPSRLPKGSCSVRGDRVRGSFRESHPGLLSDPAGQ